ncbi:MAG: hypothetical protein COA49_06535 [Bacteroidetes bacterium]|nr:MAG: hypothetical protein COA49_06535 [Bacteroidota bacterium]
MTKAFWGGLCILFSGGLYLLTNCMAESSPTHFTMYMEFEKEIPQIPEFITIYESYYILLALNFVIIKLPNAIRSLSISLIVSSVIASIIFIIFPGELGFSRSANTTGFEAIFSFLHTLDLPYNLYPSLHITFSTISVFAIINQTKSKLFHALLIFWLILISFSVVLVHQHHIFDIITGYILSWLTIHFIYLKGVNADNVTD